MACISAAAKGLVVGAAPAQSLGASTSELRSSLIGAPVRKQGTSNAKLGCSGTSRVVCQAAKAKSDKWKSLATDMSDDQQDIVRGKGSVDSLFQGASGHGTQVAMMSSYDYVSTGQRNLNNMTTEGLYIAPAFMDKMVVHVTKNLTKLPGVKVPLILGIWGGKGQGKSFQCELVFSKLGISPIVLSAGELESGNAGEPAKLIRQRYREAADIIKKGKMCCLFINDLDAGAGRMGGSTQYTVNNQMVNATLMNIADNPTNVQLPGVYNKEEIARVPIIVTGNDFSTLYAPLIRDGRMEKFYWSPTRDDRVGVCKGIFKEDAVSEDDVTRLVDTFPGQSIDFFGALRARVYDDAVRAFISEIGPAALPKMLVNNKSGPVTLPKPKADINTLLQYGRDLVAEQENVKRVQLAEEYLRSAALGNANADAINQGTFGDGRFKDAPVYAPPPPPAAAPPPPRPQAAYVPSAPAPRAASPAPTPRPASAPQNFSSNGAASGSDPRAKELESKSLGDLRAMAREWGLRGDTKAELIKLLLGRGSAPAAAAAPKAAAPAPVKAAAPSFSAPAPAPAKPVAKAPTSVDEGLVKQLSAKTMAELRQMAREKGFRGDTKAELVKLLASVPAGASASSSSSFSSKPSTSSFSAPAPRAAAPSGSLAKEIAALEVKTLGELREMARTKGLRGDTKKEIINLLLGLPASSRSPSPSPPSSRSSSPEPTRGRAAMPASSGVSGSAEAQVKALEAKTIGELRAIAREKGLRGDTKKEIIDLLVFGELRSRSRSRSPSPSPSSSPAPFREGRSATPASGSAEAQAKALEGKTLGELRTMARAKGLRGDTKKELIQLLVFGAPQSRSRSPSPSPSSSPAPSREGRSAVPASSGAASGSAEAQAKALEGKTLGELRTMARAKGLRGDTKKELIQLLVFGAPRSRSNSPSARSFSPAPPASRATEVGKESRIKELSAKSMGELREMARARGVRGDTKAELIKLLL